MSFISDVSLGFKSYYNAILFIKKHNMWYYFLLPILLFVGVYYLGFVFQEMESDVEISDDFSIFYTAWLMFVKSLYAMLAVLFLSFMRYILILLLSPVLSIVSERVERILTGNKYKFNLKQLIKDIKRTANLAIRNIIWEMGIVYGVYCVVWILVWLFSLPDWIMKAFDMTFPVIVAFYYYGFGFIDYLNERQRLTIPESVIFVRKHRGFALALGSVFTSIFVYSNDYLRDIRDDYSGSVIFTIIIIGSVILAMIPIVTMVAATLGVHELVDLKTNPYAMREEKKENDSLEVDENESPKELDE